MAANDEKLRSALTAIADASSGSISFRPGTSREMSEELGLELSRSPNPLYLFEFQAQGQGSKRVLVFTLVLDGTRRVATRAEALGRNIAVTDGTIFEVNPVLLIYDYKEERFLAVSAAKLFMAFAEEARTRKIAYSDTSSFSLTPSFDKQTISMYATLAPPDVWVQSLSSLSAGDLIASLTRFADETTAIAASIPSLVQAIQARLNAAQPTASAAPAVTHVPVPSVPDHDAGPEADVKVSPRVWRMILNAIASSPAVILVGPPGTGKTALLRKAIGMTRPADSADPLWATPDESWTARELVGGETILSGEVVFKPGWVLRALEEKRWLVLDEANRADMDRIFGGLLTWLSGGSVSIGLESTAAEAKTIQLGWKSGSSERVEAEGSIRYLAGDDWRMLGTYNALDAQRVFRFGAALGRRFLRVPIPAADPAMFGEILQEQAADLPTTSRSAINSLYAAHYVSETTQLGPALFLGICKYLRAAIAADAKSGLALDEAPTKKSSQASEVHSGGVSGELSSLVETSQENGEMASHDADTDSAGSVTVGRLQEWLAEAYVVNVGTWVANLEPHDLDELKQRVVSAGALTEDDWSWIQKMSQSLA
ncbi:MULTISPECIES: AAA family ATPase [unclassified Bradyrhizobium]|uniref:AAA family ATPase n=1 Tax=unclassified Bradyrhizobium TaxID=2631580 RepID=UPI001CD3E197|nr:MULTISPECIES: AAA family ATPase [unclassified Bradyrhizobium]MCA1377002.1 AAA family ATPase [Bradyrhizobium sp. IC4060]MCA1484124.1 AAA family ATPase [Bradyrhizobium sp. IC4061]